MIETDPSITYVPYAANRWAKAVEIIVLSRTDPRTVASWGRLAGASRATVGVWCRAAQVSTKPSLDLGRLLRAVRLTGGAIHDLQGVMDVVDPRTVARILFRAGIRGPTDPGV